MQLALLAVLASFFVPLPPPQFDRPHPNLLVVEVAYSRMERVCGRRRAQACAQIGDGKRRCIIFVTPGTRRTSRTFRHEQGHCNGWPSHHPHGVRG